MTDEQIKKHAKAVYKRNQEIMAKWSMEDLANRMNLKIELENWLKTIPIIDGENIGGIRRACFVPWDSEWNGIVRELTAQREVADASATSSTPESPPHPDSTESPAGPPLEADPSVGPSQAHSSPASSDQAVAQSADGTETERLLKSPKDQD